MSVLKGQVVAVICVETPLVATPARVELATVWIVIIMDAMVSLYNQAQDFSIVFRSIQ